jgi:prepilin-type N-terminal cleavage/methylation domain-containing protein
MSAQHAKQRTRFESAYTLIEILVGLTIIGILFGFGYAGFRDFSRRQALSGASKKIQGDLRLSQSMALSGQKPDDIKCNAPDILDSYSFYVYGPGGYRIEANCTGGTVLIKDVALPADVLLSTPSPNPIKFKILGQGTNIASGSSASLALTQSGTGSQITIEVSSGGEIK